MSRIFDQNFKICMTVPIFKIFRGGGHAPGPPRKARASPSQWLLHHSLNHLKCPDFNFPKAGKYAPQTSSLRCQISPSKPRYSGKAATVNLSTKRYQASTLSPPWVRNLGFEKSLCCQLLDELSYNSSASFYGLHAWVRWPEQKPAASAVMDVSPSIATLPWSTSPEVGHICLSCIGALKTSNKRSRRPTKFIWPKTGRNSSRRADQRSRKQFQVATAGESRISLSILMAPTNGLFASGRKPRLDARSA